MPNLTVETTHVDGVTFVEMLLEAAAPHRVRVENRLEGPVFPPRADGCPEAGWTEGGVDLTVDAGTTPLGFATPAPPEDPAAEVVAAERLTGVPDAVEAWLERVEDRVATAERLAAAEDLRAAAAAVEAAGGLGEVEALVADLERDRRMLPRLSFAPASLAARAESVSVPLAAFRRLAHSRRSW